MNTSVNGKRVQSEAKSLLSALVGGCRFQSLWRWHKQYLVTSPGMSEIFKGFDLKKVKKVLIDAGIIVPGTKNTAQTIHIPNEKTTLRVYVFDIYSIKEDT